MNYPNVPGAVAQRIGAELWPSWGATEEGRVRAAEIVRAIAEGRPQDVHQPTADERVRIVTLLDRELHGRGGR